MSKFYEFTKRENGKLNALYVRLDYVSGVFENHYPGGTTETVLNMTSGTHYCINEPMEDVIKILEENI